MLNEKIKVRVTQTDQIMDVVVFNKRAECIEVVLGEGVHSVKCQLTPTRNGNAYAGSVVGREIVYERSRAQVKRPKAQAQKWQAARRRCSRAGRGGVENDEGWGAHGLVQANWIGFGLSLRCM